MRTQKALSRLLLVGLLLVALASLGCLKAKPLPDFGPGDAPSGCCPEGAAEEKQPLDENAVETVPLGKNGEGTQERPILLNQANIEAFNRHANTPEGLKQHYQLTENIVLPDKPNNWTAIGTQETPFTGSFDGSGFTLSGLHIDAPDSDYQGLFGYIGPGAFIQNLGLTGGTVSGKGSIGGLVGENRGGTVQNCHATGSVSGTDYVGGLLGRNYFGTIQNCHTTGSVSGGSVVGGIVGKNYAGTIQNCHSAGNVSGGGVLGGVVGRNVGHPNGLGTVQNSYATGNVSGGRSGGTIGGVVGHNNYGTVQHCHATGNVSGFGVVGGVVGMNTGNAGSDRPQRGLVQNSYATGNVSSSNDCWVDIKALKKGEISCCLFTSNAGGVVGTNDIGTIQNCYATGNVSGGSSHVGGLVGRNSLGLVQNSYATGSVSGIDVVGGLVGINSKGTVKNCIALNPNITQKANSKDIGRAFGWVKRNAKNVSNNYARDGMVLTVDGKPHRPKNGSAKDGRATARHNHEDFWRTTLHWDFTHIWQWGDFLPTLRDVGGEQNPTVP